jgi:hypothetical protein
MSWARVTRSTVARHDALMLENDHLRAVILPGLGGRVWTLEDRLRGRQWIWHRETVALEVCAPGSSYDDVWAGGWEELFPNDAAGTFEGRELPDHGEWWTMAWHADHHVDDAGVTVTLTATSQIVSASCTKVFTLAHDAAELTASYRIRSLEPAAFHFLFKQHLPVRITPACRLALSGGQVEAVDPAFGTLLPAAGPFAWPVAVQGQGPSCDLRVIPPATSAEREFVYVKDLPESWCGVDDLECGASIRLHVDGATFPSIWMFLSYGGWRDTYVAVLEPCTNCRKDLTEAVRLGQSASLAPGGEFGTTVTVRLAGLVGSTS